MLSILDNALLQGLGYGIAALGVALAFRVLKYPDLTADGSFLLGGVVVASIISAGGHWATAIGLGMLAGAGAGLVTGLLYSKVGINRLLSGILTTMMAYSIAFHILSGRSNIGLLDVTTAFSWAEIYDQQYAGAGFAAVHPASVFVSLLIVIVAVSALLVLLRSNFGLLLRATGGNAMLVESLGRSPAGLTLVGLALSNALIAFAGAMVTSRQGFADVNMGTGVVIMLIASVVIGEEISRRFRFDPARRLSARFCAPIVGAFAYFFLYLLILRASIVGWLPFQVQPTDLRFLSAVVLITAIALRGRTSRSLAADEALPF